MKNPFAYIEGLDRVKQKILDENGQKIFEWDRIPAYKGSLVELSFNFVIGGTNPNVRNESIVPPGTVWHNLYNPDKRNEERHQDALKNCRDANAAVQDRPGLILSANARLDTSLVDGNVTLGESFWDMLTAQGYRFISVYSQIKMRDKESVAADSVIEKEISHISRADAPVIRDLQIELEHVEHCLRQRNESDKRQKLENRAGEIRAQLSGYPNPRIRHLQSRLSPQKGWVRVYFAHESSQDYQEMLKVETILRHCEFIQDNSAETEAGIRRLMNLCWGKMVVWNNPSTRTTRDYDLARQAKIAIQLMNPPKRERSLRSLVCKDGFFQVE